MAVNSGSALSVEAGKARDVKPKNICRRSFEYGLRAIKLYKFLQEKKNGAGWVLGKQYLRAATSIGANIEEAQAGETKADFIHKYGIAQKEAKESHYWLRLLAESGLVPARRLTPFDEGNRRTLRHRHSDNQEFEA